MARGKTHILYDVQNDGVTQHIWNMEYALGLGVIKKMDVSLLSTFTEQHVKPSLPPGGRRFRGANVEGG